MSTRGPELDLSWGPEVTAGSDADWEVVPLPSQRRDYRNQNDLRLDVLDAFVVSFTNMADVMKESVPYYGPLRQRITASYALTHFVEKYPESLEELAEIHWGFSVGRCMDRLPLELIGEIFRFASLDDEWLEHPCETLLAISHVSRMWRSVAISTPSLWTNIEDTNPKMVKLFLDRSKVCLIRVEFDLRLPEDYHDDYSGDEDEELDESQIVATELINILIPHLRRTQSLRLISTYHSTLRTILQYCRGLDAPHLESLTINTSAWPMAFGASLLAIPFTNTSRLRALKCCPTNPDLSIIGSQIKELEVTFSSTIWDCLERNLPALTRATFLFEGEIETPLRGRQVSLNALTVLALKVDRRDRWAECFKFLDHVFCPLVVSLTVKCSVTEQGRALPPIVINPPPQQSNFPCIFELGLLVEEYCRPRRQRRPGPPPCAFESDDTYRILLHVFARIPTVLCLKFQGHDAHIFLSLLSNPPFKPFIPALIKIHFESIRGDAIGWLLHLIRVRYDEQEYSAIGSLWIGHCLSSLRPFRSGGEVLDMYCLNLNAIFAKVQDVQVFCKRPKCSSQCYMYPPRTAS